MDKTSQTGEHEAISRLFHLTAILTTALFVNVINRYILKTVDLRQYWNGRSESLTLLLKGD